MQLSSVIYIGRIGEAIPPIPQKRIERLCSIMKMVNDQSPIAFGASIAQISEPQANNLRALLHKTALYTLGRYPYDTPYQMITSNQRPRPIS